MNERDLKETVGKIHIKRKMQEQIMRNIKNAENMYKSKETEKGRRRQSWQYRTAVAAFVLVIAGIGGFTVQAVVKSLVKERMESMPKEEVKTIVQEEDSRDAEVVTYSRELTDQEQERQRELTMAYNKGTFPHGELKRIEDESQIEKDVLSYVPTTGYMHLPERKLTDEEILEIIDYYEKSAYALDERYKDEFSEEVQVGEEADKAARTEVEKQGGISEAQAVAKAQEWMDKLFEKTPDGMELEHSISKDDELCENPDGTPFYVITYRLKGVEYYYFYISSSGGTLIGAEYSSGALWETQEMRLSEAEDKIQELSERAQDYLKNSFGISGEYKEIYCMYSKNDSGDGVYHNLMDFWFVREDGMAYEIAFAGKNLSLLQSYGIVKDYYEFQKEREEDVDVVLKLK